MMEIVGKKSGIATENEIDWHALYLELLPRIFHYFAYRVGNVQMAEDLASTTFERAWDRRNRYKHDLGKFEFWIFGIARKVASEHFRKVAREKYVEDMPNVSSNVDVEKAFDKKGDFDHLNSMLAELKGADRELLSLKYGAGLNNREISRQTGMSESNVGTRLHRLVTKLRNEGQVKP